MPSRRQVIKAAGLTALRGTGRPKGLKVHLEPRRPLNDDELPATVVYCRKESKVEETHDGSVLRSLVLRLQHRASGPLEVVRESTPGPDELLDPLLTWGEKALLGDSALAALVQEIEWVETEWADPIEADLTYAGAAQDFEIQYWTNRVDQTLEE